MKKSIFTLLLLLLLQTTYCQEWQLNNFNSDEVYSARLLSSTEESIIVEITLNGFSTSEVETPKGNALIINAEEMYPLSEAGDPNIPTLSIPLIINDIYKMDVRVDDAEYVEYQGVEIAPFKGHFPRSINPDDVPYTYSEVYENDAFFPVSQVKLDEPYILRDFRGQNLKVTPFAYNPQTKVLRVYNKIIVEVFGSDIDNYNIISRKSNIIKLDNDFKHIYENRFLNYSESGVKYDVFEEEGDLLIICHDEFMDAMEPYVEWKTTIGRKTTIVGTSVAGTTEDDIKSYISEQYDTNPDLTHVLLVGDSYHIPGKYISAGTYSGCSDWWYGQLSGNDYYNELIIGRFCVEEIDEVNTHIDKVIHYERDIDASDTWLTVGQGVSKREGVGGHYGEDDYEHIDNIRDDLLDYNYTLVHRDYASVSGVSSSAAIISEHINAGVSIINYCNHGSPSSWGVFSYDNDDVNALVNDDKLPFIISVACNNGQYDYHRDLCFAETWMRATNNSTGNPTGALGGVFSYILQPWIPPMYGQDEMVDILVESYSNNIKRTMGGVVLNGNMKILDIGGNTLEYWATYNAWNIFGDPTLTLRNDVPSNMQVSHNDNISINSTSFVVNAVDADGAIATLTKDHEIMGSAIINNGSAIINFSAPDVTGEATLSVFGYNKLTYLTTIDIIDGGTNVLSVSLSANPDVIALGATSTLTANAEGGDGTYSYSWSPSTSLDNANIQSPLANPITTTTYTCTVSDGTETVDASLTLIVVLPPTALTANVDGDNVELSWQAPEYVDSYNIYRDNELIASDISNTTYTEYDLPEGFYEYAVTANYEGVESPKSDVATTFVEEFVVTTYANPNIIIETHQTTISAYASGNGPVSYSWTPADDLEYPNNSSTSASPIVTTTYTVFAECGTQSATADLTVYVVEIPKGLTVTIEDNNVRLQWNEVDLAEYYVVMRDGYVLSSYVPTTTYLDEDLEEGSYCYSVKSVRDHLTTPACDEVCVEIGGDGCEPPKDITAQYYWYDGEFGALIDWNRIETAETLTEYRIYRSKDNIDYELVGTLANVPGLNHYQYSDMNNAIGTYYYKVSAYYAGIDCESEFGMAANSTNDYVMIDITSVDGISDNDIVIYPNPAYDKLCVKADHITSLTIVNMMGQIVMRQYCDSDELTIDLGNLHSGMYVLQIESKSGLLSRRINIVK